MDPDLLAVGDEDITDGTLSQSARRRRRSTSLQLIIAQFRTTYAVNTDGEITTDDSNALDVQNDVQSRVADSINNIGTTGNSHDPTSINIVQTPREDDLYTRYVLFHTIFCSLKIRFILIYKVFPAEI